jgi:hypothetical protein
LALGFQALGAAGGGGCIRRGGEFGSDGGDVIRFQA